MFQCKTQRKRDYYGSVSRSAVAATRQQLCFEASVEYAGRPPPSILCVVACPRPRPWTRNLDPQTGLHSGTPPRKPGMGRGVPRCVADCLFPIESSSKRLEAFWRCLALRVAARLDAWCGRTPVCNIQTMSVCFWLSLPNPTIISVSLPLLG